METFLEFLPLIIVAVFLGFAAIVVIGGEISEMKEEEKKKNKRIITEL